MKLDTAKVKPAIILDLGHSRELPDTLGPNKHRVYNPSHQELIPVTVVGVRIIHYRAGVEKVISLGLSCTTILLNGELEHCKRVSMNGRKDNTFVIVLKPKKIERLHCRDIPEQPILEFLEKLIDPSALMGVRWATAGVGYSMPTVNDAMPMVNESNWKLAPAKMAQLIRRGLVDGSIGFRSRGDYAITEKGITYLRNLQK